MAQYPLLLQIEAEGESKNSAKPVSTTGNGILHYTCKLFLNTHTDQEKQFPSDYALKSN